MKLLIMAFSTLIMLVTNISAALLPDDRNSREPVTTPAAFVTEAITLDETSETAEVGSLPVPSQAAAPLVGTTMTVIGLDAAVPLFDTPENRIILNHIPVATSVEVINAVEFEGATWLMVRSEDGTFHGWAARDVLAEP